VPAQVPGDAVTSSPTRAAPLIAGGSVLRGAVAAIGPVAADTAVTLLAPFEAVTSTRTVWPTSASPTASVRSVAPSIGVHSRPSASQRCHW
jgi:hypothetical protein